MCVGSSVSQSVIKPFAHSVSRLVGLSVRGSRSGGSRSGGRPRQSASDIIIGRLCICAFVVRVSYLAGRSARLLRHFVACVVRRLVLSVGWFLGRPSGLVGG